MSPVGVPKMVAGALAHTMDRLGVCRRYDAPIDVADPAAGAGAASDSTILALGDFATEEPFLRSSASASSRSA